MSLRAPLYRRLSLLLATILCVSAARGQLNQMDVFVSTGDNHFLGSSLPIDSQASIEATFDLFKTVNRTRRVYWRGLEESCWVSTMAARPENRRYYSLWEWMQTLYTRVSPDVVAVKAAHARGMEIWGVGTLWDWGGPADTPTFGDYPFPFESKLKREHPEWAPMDRHGYRHQGGPIELAYPEARRALADLIVSETVKAGYDGITFLTYCENYAMRFQDEFGFSEPIVRDFKQLHGIDITKDPFKRGASREDWMRLRGTYVTAFLRELKTALAAHQVKLGMIISPNDPRAPLPWNVPELMLTAGSHHMDVETWVREGLVDSLCVYGNSSRAAQAKAIDDLRFLTRGTGCEVSFMTSSPFADAWSEVQKSGIATVLAVSDDAQHLARSFIPEQTAEALSGKDLAARLRALQQIIEGHLTVEPSDVVPLATSASLIERRMALQALGKLKATDAVPVLEHALEDPENGVRCVAALALGDVSGPQSCARLLEAVAQHGNHMLVECAVIALRRQKPFPTAELAAAIAKHPAERVREVAVRAVQPAPAAELIPVLTAALQDQNAFVRYAATDALGHIRRTPQVATTLLGALDHTDVAVANRAALSLTEIAARQEPEITPLRPKLLAALETAFRRYASPSAAARADADWGFRPVGNALRQLGTEGEAILKRLRDQRENPRLAELAWLVLDLHQQPNSFSQVTEAENEAAFSRRPTTAKSPVAKTTPALSKNLRVDPLQGNDANDGRLAPVKTIARAVRLAQPGDTVHLTPARYFESIDLTGKAGEPEKPITVDGHGAILDGSEPVRAADWEALGHGLFRKVKLLPHIDPAIIQRWFFLWDGHMNHMGRTSKGRSEPLKKPEDLQTGEWTYVQAEDAFYLRIAEGQSLDAAHIRYPQRSSGVILSSKAAHLVVRNVIATHVYNDGYNIHGAIRDSVFENIAAVECGDDGFSAHEDAECRIDGFVSIGNSTGLCDTVSSITHYRNLYIADCLGYDVFFIGDSPHSIENGLIESTAQRPFESARHTDRPQVGLCEVRLENVHFRRAAGLPGELRIGRDSHVTASRSTFTGFGLTLSSGAIMSADRCLFQGREQKAEFLLFANSTWSGAANRYDFASIRHAQTTYTPKTFADFQKLTGTDRESLWPAEAAPLPANTGADEPSLKGLAARAAEVLQRLKAN